MIAMNSIKEGSSFQFDTEKELIILKGRFISLHPETIWNWIIKRSGIIAQNSHKVRIDLDIEYISSRDIQYLYLLLKCINNLKTPSAKLIINWKYNSFDTDQLELGKTLKDSLKGNINFQMIEKLTCHEY
jgi:hypothetical protein